MAWHFHARGAEPAARAHRATSGYRSEEIARLAEFRGETVEQFAAKFVRRVKDRYSLIEKPGGDCIFWDKEAGCTVYPARPVQCQTWPFWPENVETETTGTTSAKSAPARAAAVSTPWMRSFHPSPRPRNEG